MRGTPGAPPPSNLDPYLPTARKPTPMTTATALTPDQIRLQELIAAEQQRAADLRARAFAFAIKLNPGRVYESCNGFAIMFGDPTSRGFSLAGCGLVELTVEVSIPRPRDSTMSALELLLNSKPELRFSPRCYSLGSDATLDSCEAQGAALVEAARFGRMLAALTA